MTDLSFMPLDDLLVEFKRAVLMADPVRMEAYHTEIRRRFAALEAEKLLCDEVARRMQSERDEAREKVAALEVDLRAEYEDHQKSKQTLNVWRDLLEALESENTRLRKALMVAEQGLIAAAAHIEGLTMDTPEDEAVLAKVDNVVTHALAFARAALSKGKENTNA